MRHTLIALAFALPLIPATPADYSARVVGISDGDTITVLTAKKRQVKIRLHGIDAPESAQDFGARAKQAASDLAYGQTVTIRPKDTDRYGRTVARVVLPDGRELNRELVAGGWAWWYRQYAPSDTVLRQAEATAKQAKRGLWSQANPIPPWEWRSGGKAAVGAGVVANTRSKLYHLPNCRGVAAMKAANKREFASEAEAIKAGYRKAGDCR